MQDLLSAHSSNPDSIDVKSKSTLQELYFTVLLTFSFGPMVNPMQKQQLLVKSGYKRAAR